MNKEIETFFLKEIEIIQRIIDRMAHNSFLIKGWTVTLVVATLLLKGTEIHISIALIPLIVFWFLDGYFLWQERLYRKLYDWVVKNRLDNKDNLFDMNAYRFEPEVDSKFRVMFSITIGWFYGSTALLIIIYIIFVSIF